MTETSLTITDRSVSFIPPPGAISVRIPYDLVQDVEVLTGVVQAADDDEVGAAVAVDVTGGEELGWRILRRGQSDRGSEAAGALQ